MTDEPESNNPFASRVTSMVDALRGSVPSRTTAQREIVTGLSAAVAAVPDGMAGGVLAGVNPIFGLYAAMIGPFVGGIFASTQLLRITSTSAAAIAAAEAISAYHSDSREGALFLLVVLIGALQVIAGVLKLGRFTRFVSHSVMIGFLSGIAVLIVLGQLGNFTGYSAPGNGKIMQTINLARNLGQIDPYSVVVGSMTIVLALWLPRTRLRSIGTLIALIIPSLLVVLLKWESVATVSDVGEIIRGLPIPKLPSLSLLSVDLITASFAIAAVILVQGAGVSQSVRNPDGRPSNASRDFTAQGLANIATGLCQGVPVGGSVNQTAFAVLAGARTRWTNIFSGLWIAAFLLLIPGLVGYIAMPALAALLIIAGVNTIKIAEGVSIWRTGWRSRLAIVTTFLATLVLPVQVAVGIGAVLSALLYLNTASTDIRLTELVETSDGLVHEQPAPKVLPPNSVTVLNIYGSLFYAGARELEEQLPSPRGVAHPVVVLRLRGRTSIGATLVDVLTRYAGDLAQAGGRLYLAGVDQHVSEQIARSGKLRLDGPVQVFTATDTIGQATRDAMADAEAWLIQHQDTPTSAEISAKDPR